MPSYNHAEHREGKDRIFTEELHEDLRSVLQALKDAGADDSYKAPNLGYSVREFCSEGSISILFDEVFGCDSECSKPSEVIDNLVIDHNNWEKAIEVFAEKTGW